MRPSELALEYANNRIEALEKENERLQRLVDTNRARRMSVEYQEVG